MNEPEYKRLKQFLIIDPLRLNQELEELPPKMQEAAEHTADAQRERDIAKDTLEMASADADWRVRDRFAGTKFTESMVKAEIAVDEDVVAATAALRDAEYNLNLWKSLADAIRTKSYSIGKIVELVAVGYATPNSLYAERRTHLNRERKRLSER